MSRKLIYLVLATGLFSYLLYDSFSQPTEKDLKGDFKEVAFYRNEQNTGPVLRIYAVTVSDTLWNEMETYGNYKPHNKYGNTKVYFFLNNKPSPTFLFSEEGNFDPKYQKNCVAKYEKGSMGQVVLVKYPFMK